MAPVELAARPEITVQATETARTDSARNDSAARRERADRDGKAVVGFVSGLVGLLVGNPVLGPLAIVLAVMSLRGGTRRRGRALLALALGVADLVVFVVLMLHSASGHGGLSWHFAGL
jgi:thiol:disulfide interchange protein